MKFYFKLAVQTAIVGCICLMSFVANAATYSSTLAVTPVHRTCYNDTYSASFLATITPTSPATYVYGTDYTFNMGQTTFSLRTTASGPNGAVLATSTGSASNSTISGSFNMSSFAFGVYTIYASITITDLHGGKTVVTTPIASFTIGYQTVWNQMTDMQADPNSYSAKRNILTPGQTYANAISANNTSGAGWVSVAPQFANNTGSIFVVIGSSTTAITNPTTQTNYVEFRRTGVSTGAVYAKIGASTYTLTGVTYNSRIRIVRDGSLNVRFYLDNTETLINGATTFMYSGDWNIGVFASQLNDGVLSVITSSPCSFDNQYYYLKDEVEESAAYVNGSKLKIKFDEDYYDNAGTLTYTIQCLNDDSTPSTSTVTKTKHENWLDIPLTGLVAGNIYLVTVKDSKGRVKYLKFKKA